MDPMRAAFQLGSLLALLLVATGPAEAKVLAQGKPAKGVYWQKVQKQDGSIVYMCRSTEKSKLVSADQCDKAKASKP